MMLCGAMCAGVYDIALLLRRIARGGAMCTGVIDLFFGMLLAAGMSAAALELRRDPFRMYMFLGIGLGVLLWFATVGLLLRKLCALGEALFKNHQKSRQNLQKEDL